MCACQDDWNGYMCHLYKVDWNSITIRYWQKHSDYKCNPLKQYNQVLWNLDFFYILTT